MAGAGQVSREIMYRIFFKIMEDGSFSTGGAFMIVGPMWTL